MRSRSLGFVLLLLPSLAWAAPQECGGPEAVELTPIRRTQTQLKGAPPDSRDTLLLEISVLPSGVPEEVKVVRSSGLPSWDRNWAQHVQRQWRWQPINCTRPVKTQLELIPALLRLY